MSGGGKGGKKQTSTSTVAVPKYLEDRLKQGVWESQRLYEQGAPEFFAGQTYADFTDPQIAAQQGTIERATNGSPLVAGAQDLTQRTINGEYLNNNPYLDQIMERYGAKANSMALGSFNKSGRLGSSANVAASQQAIGDATLPYLFQNYQQERQNQIGASQFAPSLADYDYRDLAALSGVGEIQQAQNQLGIDEARSRYEYDQMAESNWLDQYLARINGSAANNLTTQTQTQKTGGGGLGSVLGSALSIGSMFVPGGQLAGLMGAGMGAAGGSPIHGSSGPVTDSGSSKRYPCRQQEALVVAVLMPTSQPA